VALLAADLSWMRACHVLHMQGMGPAFTAGIVQQLGVTATAALVARFEGPLTGDLVQHFGPGMQQYV
jgi:hypothetical protein